MTNMLDRDDRTAATVDSLAARRPRAGHLGPIQAAVRALDVVSAADLNIEERDFDDEIVEGILGRKAMAVLYGDSNTGKSFLAADLGAAVESGRDWFGRRTPGGMVVYLATEAPGSVEHRVAAIRRKHDLALSGLFIVRSGINLFRDAADTAAILALIERLETEHGRKVELVIADTLAAIAAGANENAGEDMGLVMERADAVRRGAGAAFIWIAHCGKDATRGMRGWSGVRAGVDTEIELTTDEATGVRTFAVTKQRDLPGKGTRFCFRLETVVIGRNAWGAERTTCLVAPMDAPAQATTATGRARRPSEVAGAIDEALRAHGRGMSKGALVSHFKGRYDHSAVYREIKRMTEDGRLVQAGGMVALVTTSSVEGS